MWKIANSGRSFIDDDYCDTGCIFIWHIRMKFFENILHSYLDAIGFECFSFFLM